MLGILRNVDFLAPVSIGTSSILFIVCAVEALYFPIPGSRLAMIHWTLWVRTVSVVTASLKYMVALPRVLQWHLSLLLTF